MSLAVECRAVEKDFGRGETRLRALRSVELQVPFGELTMLVGPSGCGKTTLLSVIAGVLNATGGEVEVLGEHVDALSGDRLVQFRRKNLGFVFQQFHLLPALTAAENAAVPLLASGLPRQPSVERAAELLDRLGMGDRVHAYPSELSGGQQQRVALAAATARIGVATADLFPRFSLIGTLALQSSDLGSLFSAGSRAWACGPRFIWPLFDAGRIRAHIEVQTARQETALARYEQAVLVALEDVENALVAFAQERLRHRSLAAAVAANRRAVELSRELYTRGLGDFLSVLASQRSLFVSEDQLVQSERAVVANLITVYKALGGGWEVWTPIERAGPRAVAAEGS